MGLCNSTQKSQNDSSPSSEDRDIRFYTLLQFCDEPSFDIGKIKEISHYKEAEQPEHEFLLAKVTVVDPGSQSSRWLRIDRSRQEKATSLLNKSSSVFPAKDTVRVATQVAPLLHPPSSRMCSLQYDDGPGKPSLADFRCLLRLVHTMSPDYKLWQEQCYWFCNSIMDIMKGQFPTELVLVAAYDRRGKFKNILYMPGNAHAMTHIQRAFMSNLASNARGSNPLNQPRLSYQHQSNSDTGGPLPEPLAQPPTQHHWVNTESEVFVPSDPQSSPPVSLPKSDPESYPPVSHPKSHPRPAPPPKSNPQPSPPVSLPESDTQPSSQEEDLLRAPSSNPSNQPRLPYQPSSDPGGPFPAHAPALPQTPAEPPTPPHRVNSGSESEPDPQQSAQEDVSHGAPSVSPYSNATLLSNPSNPHLPFESGSGPGGPLPAQTPAFPRTPLRPPTSSPGGFRVRGHFPAF